MILLFLVSGSAATASSSSWALSNFRFIRTAVLPENIKISANKSYAVKLDEIFFQATENLSNDLCMVDMLGRSVPFVLKKIPAVTEAFRENQLSGKIVRNQQLPDGRNAIDFELEENNKFISAVELVGDKLPAKTILSIAIGDGKNWQLAVDKLPLSDKSKFPEVLNRRFPLPERLQGKIVRLILEKGKFPQLEAVRVFEQQRLEPLQGSQIIRYKLSTLGSKSESNQLKIAFNTSYTPLTRLELDLEKDLYLHKVTVLGSNDRRKWQEFSSGTIRKIDLDSLNTLDFPETRYKYIILQIDHPANEPVRLKTVKAFGPAYCWVVNGGKDRNKLTIYYNPETSLPPASHQLATDSEPTADYKLSAQQTNNLRKTGVQDRSSWSHLAGALIVILTFIAAIVITSKVKSSQKILPED